MRLFPLQRLCTASLVAACAHAEAFSWQLTATVEEADIGRAADADHAVGLRDDGGEHADERAADLLRARRMRARADRPERKVHGKPFRVVIPARRAERGVAPWGNSCERELHCSG